MHRILRFLAVMGGILLAMMALVATTAAQAAEGEPRAALPAIEAPAA